MKHFLLRGDRDLSATSLWGLYATLILQYNKNTRRAYLILPIVLHGKEVAFKRIGIFFFDALQKKKINKYNQSNILEKNVSVLFNPSLPIRILPL